MTNNQKSTEVTLKLDSEWFKVTSSLSTVLGFETLEDYVSDCIETNVRMYIAGGDNIDERFRDHYKQLVFEPREDSEQQTKDQDQTVRLS